MSELINALNPGAPLNREYDRITRAVVGELEREFDRLQDGDLLAIHDIRKWLKRFRGFLRLYRPSLGKRYAKLDGAACTIARLLAGARELQAMSEALSLLAVSEPALLKSSLARRLSKAAGGRPGNEPIRGAIDIDLAVARFQKFRKKALRTQIKANGFDAIGAGLAMTYRRTRRAFDKAVLSDSSEDFHTLRRHANYHRQHMRMLAPCWSDMMDTRAEAGSTLHDMLGHEHDLFELTQWARAAAKGRNPKRDKDMIAILGSANRQRMRNNAVKIASQLFAEKPDRFIHRIEKYWTAAAG